VAFPGSFRISSCVSPIRRETDVELVELNRVIALVLLYFLLSYISRFRRVFSKNTNMRIFHFSIYTLFCFKSRKVQIYQLRPNVLLKKMS
jgi:hypothetical protein